MSLTTEQRFWSKVNKDGPTMPHMKSACWVWTGRTVDFGYGSFDTGPRLKKHTNAHRVSFAIAHGPIPDGLFVLHECDNPPCVNPDHLHLGTHTDNMREMKARGRMKPPPFNPPRGEAHRDAKLTATSVCAIRSLIANGIPDLTISRRFGVGHSAIWKIRTGKTWRHVPDPAAPFGVVVPTFDLENER